MALDAYVCCDCIEKGRIRAPHPFPERLCIGADGSPDVWTEDLSSDEECEMFDTHWAWQWAEACEHPRCHLVEHRLGNISLIASLRGVVARLATEGEWPILRQKVIYSGIHCADWLSREKVELLALELGEVPERDWAPLNKKEALWLRVFLEQMEELIAASRIVNKPIVF